MKCLILLSILLQLNNPKYIGVDVSHHNSVSNWKQINVDFIYAKATEGSTYVDPKFDYFVKNANKNNILIGAYHFFTTTSSGKEQFNNFKNITSKYNLDLIPVIDIECINKHNMSKAQLKKELRIFINLCYKEYGKKPIIYSGQNFYIKYLTSFSDCYYWCGSINEHVYINHIMHQTCIKSVPGFKNKVDFNELYCSIDKIKL